MEADTCRLCLRPIDKAKSTDLATESTKLAMLKEFLPEVKLDIAQNTQICYSCLQDLEVSYNFKQGVLVNEATIQAKLEENDLKNIDLRIMLDDFAKKEVKPDDFICRTCFSICETPSISLFDAPSNMMPCSFVKKMCQLVFELEFITSDKPVLCDDCWNTLQTVYNFRKCCIKTDKKLLAYIAKMNLTKVTIAEFKTFAKEDLPNDNDEYSSDDELGTHVKEELVDEDELKFNPDEASCSSGSFKVKEETAVKCESDLNSEDENIKDEPEYLDLKAVKSEASELEGEDCKMEIGEVKVDAEGDNSAGPSGFVFCSVATYKEERNKSSKYLRRLKITPTATYNLIIGSDSRKEIDITEVPSNVTEYVCCECSYVTSRQSCLSLHLKKHQERGQVLEPHRKELSCTECGFSTPVKTILTNHMLVHADPSTIDTYGCFQCSYRTKRKYNLQSHMKVHEDNFTVKVFSCTQCSFQCKRKHELNTHMTVHGNQLYPCQHCDYKTKWKVSLKRHMLTHLDPEKVTMFQCTTCSYKSNRFSNLKLHMARHNGTLKVKLCTKCEFKAVNQSALREHMKKKHLSDFF